MSRLFLRQFSDVDFFALAYATVLTTAWYCGSLVQQLGEPIEGILFTDGLAPVVLILLALVFFALSLHHVCSMRTKTALETQYMLTMALAIMLFCAIVLLGRMFSSHTLLPLLVLQCGYIAWMMFLIRHINDDGKHLHVRMLVPEEESRLGAILVVCVSFLFSAVTVVALRYSWEVTLALLTTTAIPLARTAQSFLDARHVANGGLRWTHILLVATLLTLAGACAIGLLTR